MDAKGEKNSGKSSSKGSHPTGARPKVPQKKGEPSSSGRPVSTSSQAGAKSFQNRGHVPSRSSKKTDPNGTQKTSPTAPTDITKIEPLDTEDHVSPQKATLTMSHETGVCTATTLKSGLNEAAPSGPTSPNTSALLGLSIVKTEPGTQSCDKANTVGQETGAKPKSSQKRGRFVPSRYLQQAEQSAIQRRKSPAPLGRDSGKKEHVSVRGAPSPKSKDYTSSTPRTAWKGLNYTFADGNISSIAPVGHQTGAIPKVKTALGPAFNADRKIPSLSTKIGPAEPIKPIPTTTSTATATRPAPKKKAPTVDELDLLYSKEVLLAYKVQEAEEELEKSVKDNLKLLWALSCKNRELMEKDTSLKIELQRKRHLLNTHRHLKEQSLMLETTLPDTVSLERKLHDIATSLDQHQSSIPTKNIIFPKDNESLVPVLEEMNTALDVILDKNEGLQKELSQLSSATDGIREVLAASECAKTRIVQLVADIQTLSRKEQSVLIQRFQENMNDTLI